MNTSEFELRGQSHGGKDSKLMVEAIKRRGRKFAKALLGKGGRHIRKDNHCVPEWGMGRGASRRTKGDRFSGTEGE